MQPLCAVISLEKIVRNAVLVKKRAGVPLIAVVKDDAYGHGAERVALALHGTADLFAVATVREGAALRVAGISEEILVLTPALNEEEALSAAEYSLTPSFSSLSSLRLFVRAAKKFGFFVRGHLAVNTGMNRYGVRPEETERACREALSSGVEIAGCYSHFYRAEDENAREMQYVSYLRAAEKVKKYFPGALLHLSATGGVLAGGKYRFGAVRSGIALYGYLPEGSEERLPVLPAMKLYAWVSHRGRFTGGGVGYMSADRQYGALHTLRAGYGDGLFRAGGLGIGNLCMDACVAQGDAPFGAKRRVLKDVEKYAREHGTTVYEVLVAVGRRADKFYV